MRIRHPLPIASAAVLLLAMVALAGWTSQRAAPSKPPAAAAAAEVHPRALPPAGTAARRAFERCREHVVMIHDVHWAATCMVVASEQRARRLECLLAAPPDGAGASRCLALELADDSADCMLPNDSAARLNRARTVAENRCVAEAEQSERVAGAMDR